MPPVSDLGLPQAAKATTSSASETKDTEKSDCAGAEGLSSVAYMESCRDNLSEGAVLHKDLQPLKRVCSNPLEVPLNVTLTQPAQDGFDRLLLLGLPAETRKQIYAYIVPEKEIRLRHVHLGHDTSKQSSWTNNSAYPGFTQVCRLLRLEYFPVLLSNAEICLDLDSVGTYAVHFDRILRHCQASLSVFCVGSKSKLEMLPLLSLAVEVPGLIITFNHTNQGLDELREPEVSDLQRLLELSRTNLSWQKYVLGAITAVSLYYPKVLCDHERSCAMVASTKDVPGDAWLHITFAKNHKQLWMDGTHSFEELQMLLVETGLNGLTTMDVQVGLTSMKNRGWGKGLRIREEQQAVDWLLGRNRQRPKGVKGVPRMLRALE